jgi:nucleotide-binding universal stress UspA family protein
MTSPQTAPEFCIRNLVVLVDGTAEARAAVEAAATIARCFGAGIHLLHFIQSRDYAMAVPQTYAEVLKDLRDRHEAELRVLAGSETLRGLEPRIHVERSEITEGLGAFTHDFAIDLIVVSSSGKTGLVKWFEGSTAEDAFRNADTPVMVLGPKAVTAVPPHGFRRILCTTDLSAGSWPAAAYAMALAGRCHAKATLLYVMADDAKRLERRDVMIAEAASALRRWAALNGSSGAEQVVSEGVPAKVISELAADMKADLIVAGAKRMPALGIARAWATAYAVMREAHCPTVLVREP